MPKPAQQKLYSVLLLDDGAPCLISKAEPDHITEETLELPVTS